VVKELVKRMDIPWITGVVLLFGFTFYVTYYVLYNRLTSLRNGVEQSWSHIEVELQRRFDLIGNLIEVCKGYTKHERETFQEITKLRSKNLSPAEAKNLSEVLSTELKKVMVIIEAYPELKADKQFHSLQKELSNTEDRIAGRRSAYNTSVNLLENFRLQFPSSVIAWASELKEVNFFDAEEEVNEVIKVAL
jgi:LemA protein